MMRVAGNGKRVKRRLDPFIKEYPRFSLNWPQPVAKSYAHKRQGATVTNFDMQLPQLQAQLAKDTLKDTYIFDFLTLDKPFREREIEAGLVKPEYAGKINFYCNKITMCDL